MKVFIIALSLCVVQIAGQRCLLSREDFVPCQYRNMALRRAGANQFSTHSTRLRNDATGTLICNVRAQDQSLSVIPNLGTDEMRVLTSPGYLTGDDYERELRVEYLVQCGAGELAFYNVTDLSLQSEEDCVDDEGNARCQDYLQIVRQSAGAVEECGTTPSVLSVLQLETGNFTVVFRTSEDDVVGGGFQMYVLCFRPADTSLPDCTEVSEFTSGVCATLNRRSAGSWQEWHRNPSNSFSYSPHQNRGGGRSWTPYYYNYPYSYYPSQGKTSYYTVPPIAKFYVELFPNSGFPPFLMIQRDLALFHHQWVRQRRLPGVKFTAVDILYNETVNYSKNTIFVMDLRGRILARYCYVRILKTFDSRGVIRVYYGGIRDNRNPHFQGAGLLRIVNKVAYFQLFRIDPREFVPDEEEQRELLLMNTPLLESLLVNRISPQMDPKPRPNFRRFPYRYHQYYHPWRQQRATNNPQFNDADREAVLAALRSADSCTAVLRAQSRATLTFFSEIDSDFVDCLRTFNITCSLTGNVLLSCTTTSTVVPGRTVCQIDSQTPIPCDPFSEEPFEIPTPGEFMVTVRARNCEGQSAVDEVLFLDD